MTCGKRKSTVLGWVDQNIMKRENGYLEKIVVLR